MSSSGFLPKKQTSDWLTYLVYQLEACFFWWATTWTHGLTQISEKIDFSSIKSHCVCGCRFTFAWDCKMIRLLVILLGIFQLFHSSIQSGTTIRTNDVEPIIQERIEFLCAKLGVPEWKVREFLREVQATGSK